MLDGPKTGVSVCPEVFKQHREMFGGAAVPQCKEDLAKGKRRGKQKDESLRKTMVRRRALGPFALDVLLRWARAEIDTLLGETELRAESLQFPVLLDEDLAGPWNRAKERAARVKRERDASMELELELIHAHVAASRKAWKDFIDQHFTSRSIVERQNHLRRLSKAFHSAPAGLLYFDDDEVARVRASYAYVYDHGATESKWSRFPWDMSLRVLCEIKAKALGPSKTMTQGFYSGMQMSRTFLSSDHA